MGGWVGGWGGGGGEGRKVTLGVEIPWYRVPK